MSGHLYEAHGLACGKAFVSAVVVSIERRLSAFTGRPFQLAGSRANYVIVRAGTV